MSKSINRESQLYFVNSTPVHCLWLVTFWGVVPGDLTKQPSTLCEIY